RAIDERTRRPFTSDRIVERGTCGNRLAFSSVYHPAKGLRGKSARGGPNEFENKDCRRSFVIFLASIGRNAADADNARKSRGHAPGRRSARRGTQYGSESRQLLGAFPGRRGSALGDGQRDGS